MTVYLVGAGPGDPGLLTRRGAELLARADVVLYDRLVDPAVLSLAAPTAELVNVGKRPGGGAGGGARQEEINGLLVAHGRQGKTVVRLKGGDPFLFGRGGEEAEALTLAGVRWQVVPGVTSAFGVPAAAGIPVTHRGLSSSVTVVTGRVGDPNADSAVDWDALARAGGTLVVLMGMQSRAEIADALQRAGKPGHTPCAVIAQGATPAQAVVRTTLDALAAVDFLSPAVIVIGPVAALGAGEALGPLHGLSVVVTRSGPRSGALTDALREAGASVVELPLTAPADPADGGVALRAEAARVGHYEWVVVTSANAVGAFMGALRDARALGATKVAAVGPATADALRAAGVEPDLIPSEHRAQGLVQTFPRHDASARNAHILFPAGDLAPSTIPAGLGEKGWVVTRVEAYRTVALPAPEPAIVARVAGADAVTFGAGSAVEAYGALVGPGGGPLPVPRLVVCIGPSTAARARALGLAGVVESTGVSPAEIVAALVADSSGLPADGS